MPGLQKLLMFNTAHDVENCRERVLFPSGKMPRTYWALFFYCLQCQICFYRRPLSQSLPLQLTYFNTMAASATFSPSLCLTGAPFLKPSQNVSSKKVVSPSRLPRMHAVRAAHLQTALPSQDVANKVRDFFFYSKSLHFFPITFLSVYMCNRMQIRGLFHLGVLFSFSGGFRGYRSKGFCR